VADRAQRVASCRGGWPGSERHSTGRPVRVERHGRARTKVLPDAKQDATQGTVREHVEPGSEVFTDCHPPSVCAAVHTQDVAEAVDAVPDVEAAPENRLSEVEQVAAGVLAALPLDVREALARMVGEGTNR